LHFDFAFCFSNQPKKQHYRFAASQYSPLFFIACEDGGLPMAFVTSFCLAVRFNWWASGRYKKAGIA
jgi:hypothetical protein